MDITEQQVAEAMDEAIDVWSQDWYVGLIEMWEKSTGKGTMVSAGIHQMRDEGLDLSWFDGKWPEEMNCTKQYVSANDYMNADAETRVFWARTYALQKLISDLYSDI